MSARNVNAADNGLDNGNQVLFLAPAHNPHVMPAGEEDLAYRADVLAGGGQDRKPEHLVIVELVVLERGELTLMDRKGVAAQGLGLLTGDYPRKGDEQKRGARAQRGDPGLGRLPAAVLELDRQPLFEGRARKRVGPQPEFSAQTVGLDQTAERNKAVGTRRVIFLRRFQGQLYGLSVRRRR